MGGQGALSFSGLEFEMGVGSAAGGTSFVRTDVCAVNHLRDAPSAVHGLTANEKNNQREQQRILGPINCRSFCV